MRMSIVRGALYFTFLHIVKQNDATDRVIKSTSEITKARLFVTFCFFVVGMRCKMSVGSVFGEIIFPRTTSNPQLKRDVQVAENQSMKVSRSSMSMNILDELAAAVITRRDKRGRARSCSLLCMQ